MDYCELGKTGLKVSRVALGTANFGTAVPPATATEVINAALDHGINVIDTANVYGNDAFQSHAHAGTPVLSEEIVGRAIEGRRREIVLATKVGNRNGPGPDDAGLSRTHIIRELEGSLRRLRTEYVDLYQVHNWDARTPIDESLGAFDQLVRHGKVRFLGCSNFSALQVCRYLWSADKNGYAPLAALQPLYNLLEREIEAELLPLAREFGIGILAYSPLAGGVLTGKYRSTDGAPPGSRAAEYPGQDPRTAGFFPKRSPRNMEVVETLARIASEFSLTPARLALAWLYSRREVSSVIVGVRTQEQLADNIASLTTPAPAAALEQVDALTDPRKQRRP